jgi:hypothetical protein
MAEVADLRAIDRVAYRPSATSSMKRSISSLGMMYPILSVSSR